MALLAMAVGMILTAPAAQADLSEGLVAYWAFNEGDGETAYDCSGNGNHGTVLGANWVDGIAGGALSFDGDDDHIAISDPNGLDFGSDVDFSFSAWINADQSQASYPTMIGRRDASFRGYIFFLYCRDDVGVEGELAVQLNNGQHHYNYLSLSEDLRDHAWHHVAATGDRDGYLTFYVDGEEQPGTYSISGIGDIDSSSQLYIGWEERNPYMTHFSGTIDEVRIYGRVLSETEIQYLYGHPGTSVADVVSSQEVDAGKLVNTNYRLDAEEGTCNIAVRISDDGGETWEITPTAISGDIGEGIVPGPGKHIVWNPVIDLPDAVGSNFRVRVTADGVYYADSNTLSMDNRGGNVQVEQRAEGIFLSDVPFQNTFKAVVNDWGEGAPGTVTFDLNGQSVTLPYVECGVETDAFQMTDLPAGECAVSSTLLVTARDSAGTLVGQTGVRLQCIDRPWFMPPAALVQVHPLSPFQWGQDIVYELCLAVPGIPGCFENFQNLDATWQGENALFKNYGGLISGGELTIEFNGAKGEYTFGIGADLNPTEDKPKLYKLLKPTTHKKKMSWKGESTLSAGFSARATISPASGCFDGGPEICANGQFGYEWKMIPIGPLFGIPGLWFTGKAGFDISPELCFNPWDLDLDCWYVMPTTPFTEVDVTLNLMGQGGLEFGIPYFLSVFGGLEGNAEGVIHICGEEIPTCWDWPLLADLNFDVSIVGYARLAFAEWELGRFVIIEWSCPQGKGLLLMPLGDEPVVMRKAGRQYLENGEPYAAFRPGVRSGQDVKRDASRGETDEVITSNTNLEATPATAGWGNLTLVATSEDDPNTPDYVEHEIQAVFRDAAVWGEKIQITDNTDPDIQPTAGFDASGQAIVAWTAIAGVTGDETLAEMKAKMEIAYSVYDDDTETWDTPVQVTSNGSLDALPQIVRGADGSTNLVWLRCDDNSLPIGPDEPLGTPPAVLVARWNGVEFGVPEVLIPTCDSTGAVRYTRSEDGREYLLWTWDADGDLGTIDDREVVEAHTVGGVWTDPFVLTTDSVPDTAAGLVATPTGVVAYFVQAGGTEEQPQDQLLGRVFDGSQWGEAEVLMSAPTTILSPSFAVAPDGSVSCAWVGPAFNTDGKIVAYASSPDGWDAWSEPQEMAVSSLPTAPACTYAGTNVQVCYVSARPARGAEKIEFGLKGARSTAFDVRLLDHAPYTDLWVEAAGVVVSPQPPEPNEPATISVTVHLSGDFDQNGVEVQVFDGDPLQGGTLIGSNSTDLTPGSEAVLEFPWTYPTDFAEHEVYAVIDPNNAIVELSETNNAAHVAIGGLNLEAMSVHPEFWTAQHVGVRLTLGNTGYANLTDVAYELRRDTETGPLILSGTVPNIAAREQVETVVPWDITLTDPGVYELFLIVDPSGLIEENEEGDNGVSGTIRVLPDLQAEQWSAAIVGTTAQVTVRNIGAKPMAATTVRVIRSGQTLGEASLAALDAGASADMTIPLASPVHPGTVTIWVNPDSIGDDEVTLSNNEAIAAVASSADLDDDGDVDADDFAIFAVCLAGPQVTTPPPGATAEQFARADLDGDLDVDLADSASFQRVFGSGSR